MAEETPETPETPETQAEELQQERKRPGRKKGQQAPKGKWRKLTSPDLVQLITLKNQGMRSRDIAKVLDVHESSVSRAISNFEPLFKELQEVKTYRESRAEILQALQLKTLKSLARDDAQAKASINQSAYAFEVLHKAERLETGKSTENKAVSFVKVDPSDTDR
jgi:transposase